MTFSTTQLGVCGEPHGLRELAQPFKIHSVPTLLFVNNGELLDVRVGALPGPALTTTRYPSSKLIPTTNW